MRTSAQVEVELNEQELQVTLIVRHWGMLFPSGKLPSPMQCMVWLRAYGFDLDVVLQGIDALARKIVISGEYMEFADSIRYCSACMRSINNTNRKATLTELEGV